jgi:tRNA(Met) cytidine acetyltransferase
VSPGPFRRLALHALVGTDHEGLLTPRQERLLVRKVLQARPWPAVAAELGSVSTSQCMKTLGRAYRPLVERAGTAAARRHADRYE